MISTLPVIILRFFLLLLAQVLVFNHINLSSFVNPYVFPLFVLLLPFETPRMILMILGLLSGLILDILIGTTGMHAAAGLMLGYLRPFLINAITPKGTEFEISPNVYAQGITWFLFYLGISMFLYLFFYFVVEAATFLNFFYLVVKIILSTAASVMFMMIFLFLFSARKKRRFA